MSQEQPRDPTDPHRPPSRGAGTRRLSRRHLAWTIAALAVSIPVALLPHLDVLAGGLVPIAQALLPVGALALLALAIVPLLARAWLAAGVLALGAALAVVPALTPVSAASVCPSPAPLTVLSFNAKFAGADPEQLADLIASSGADVVMLVETSEDLIDDVLSRSGLAEALPHRTKQVSQNAYKGTVILSAYPLSAETDIPGSVFDQVSAVATLPDGTGVRVAAVHPPPPVGQPGDWHSAVTAIDEWIRATTDSRLVVAGDFNASYSHPVFRHLTSGLRMAAEAAGVIPWPTWPQEKPVPAFTAIDHVLARGAVPTGWDSAYIPGSDHRAVIAEWALCTPSVSG